MTRTGSRRRRMSSVVFTTIAVICSMLTLSTAPAASQSQSVPDPVTDVQCTDSLHVFFINGVQTSQGRANADRDTLASAVGRYFEHRPVKYDALYNSTAANLGDFSETFGLRIAEAINNGDVPTNTELLGEVGSYFLGHAYEFYDSGELARFLAERWSNATLSEQEYVKGHFANAASILLAAAADTLAQMVTAMYHLVQDFANHSLTPRAQGELDDMVRQVQAAVDDHERVVLVAHSEGNLFANAVYERLSDTSEVRVVYVAPPTANLHGTNTHTLIDTDAVILALGALAGSTPTVTDRSGYPVPTLFWHDFIESYMSGVPAARQRIIGQVRSAFIDLLGADNDPVIDDPILTSTANVGATPSPLPSSGGSWRLAKGSWPNGITGINPNGTFIGTPTASGHYDFTVEACRPPTTESGVEHWHGDLVDVSMDVSPGPALTGRQISIGSNHTCALVGAEDTVKCWGRNTYGQLGNGTTVDSYTPVIVNGLSGVNSIASGGDSTCALLAGGFVKCWGYNHFGNLGNGTITNSKSPVTVMLTPVAPDYVPTPLSGATAIAASGAHVCALLASGRVKCWGADTWGQLGNGHNSDSWTAVDVMRRPIAPAEAQPLTGATGITVNGIHSCAIVNGGAMCWGDDTYGQLGNGANSSSNYPDTVIGVGGVISMAAGTGNTCAIVAGGSVLCWGRNNWGQLGDGTTTNSQTAVGVLGVTGATAIDAYGQSCAVVTSGKIQCWGNNFDGELGNGTRTNSSTAVDVVGITGATSVSTNSGITCAVATGSALKCWGNNFNGQFGNGTNISSLTPVAAGPP